MKYYQMKDGTLVCPAVAQKTWNERKKMGNDGYFYSCATGNRFLHESLHLSSKGRYYTLCWEPNYRSTFGNDTHKVQWVTPKEATRWLLKNKHPVPKDLEKHIAEIVE